MTTADWEHMEHATMGFDSSSDLFGGVLFGDELMDLYNSDTNVRSGNDHHTSSLPEFVNNRTEEGNNSAGGVSGESSLDKSSSDNLGAFHPAPSCSELETLMPKSDNNINCHKKVKEEKKTNTKKRGSPQHLTGSTSSPPKKQAIHNPSSTTANTTITTMPVVVKQEPTTAPPPPPPPPLPAPVPAPAPHPAAAPLHPPRMNNNNNSPPIINTSVPPSIHVVATKNNNVRMNNNVAPPMAYVHAMRATGPPVPASAAAVVAPPPVPHHVASAMTHIPPHHPQQQQQQHQPPQPQAHSIKTQHPNLVPPPPPPKINTSVVPVAPTRIPNAVTPHPPKNTNNNNQASRNNVANGGKPQPEAQFKDVAQAAVSNLILNASSKTQKQRAAASAGDNHNNSPTTAAGGVMNSSKKTINTSSAHVAALTSSNWVAACSAGVDDDAEPGSAEAEQAAALAAASDPAAAKAARARRANLTPDERARQNRDRNREHARNTRLRKKAYVEELKKTLTELVAQRDAADLERRHETQRDLEVREVRFRVMEEFLKLRACGGDAGLLARWVAILDDGFTLTLPKTPYRQMAISNNNNNNGGNTNGGPPSKLHRTVSTDNTNGMAVATISNPHEQVMKGASESMADAAKVATFLSSLGARPHSNPITMTYLCDRKYFMMDGTSASLDWVLTTNGLLNQGHNAEIYVKGNMRAKFCPASNKLLSAELHFDTGSVLAQTRRTTYMPPNPVTQYVPTPSPLPLQPAPPVVKDVLPMVEQQQQQQQQQLTSYNYSSTISISSTDRDESSTEGN